MAGSITEAHGFNCLGGRDAEASLEVTHGRQINYEPATTKPECRKQGSLVFVVEFPGASPGIDVAEVIHSQTSSALMAR
jgi:hypothetical protein